MEYRTLGSTGLAISVLAFGAGPVAQTMTVGSRTEQLACVRSALAAGINWFDTAPGYGAGESERSLGACLRELGGTSPVHVATKVRLQPQDLQQPYAAVRRSLEGSLERLGLARVTLLQLHNMVAEARGRLPDALSVEDVLGPGGVLAALERLREEGLALHLGLTAAGSPTATAAVLATREFAAAQVPYHVLNPSAGRRMPQGWPEQDHGCLIDVCQRYGTGVLAIRVLAGGALTGKPPSPHTQKTRYFPLDLYQRDAQRAALLAARLPAGSSLAERALRFVIGDPRVASAIIGFATPLEIEQAVRAAARGPLAPHEMAGML
jgi:L-galactose dehydrogenase/L-glyceraldehyde 3-phosphate reductase